MFGHNDWQGGRPAFSFEGGPAYDEGWQPWARGPRGPRGFPGPSFDGPPVGRMLWRMARRWGFGPGPFGPGGFGPGPFGPDPEHGPGRGPGRGRGPGGPRMFGHGHLKYVLLDLLRERPKHGYEMMKDLEERSSGFYSPSAGAIYPTLQLMEDRGWVTSQTVEGKKVYAISDAGRAALKEHQDQQRPAPEPDAFGGPRAGFGPGPFGGPFHGGPFGRHGRPELRDLRHEAVETARLLRIAVFSAADDPERLARLRAIVQRTRADLAAFVGEPTPRTAPDTASTPERPDAGSSAGEGTVESV